MGRTGNWGKCSIEKDDISPDKGGDSVEVCVLQKVLYHKFKYESLVESTDFDGNFPFWDDLLKNEKVSISLGNELVYENVAQPPNEPGGTKLEANKICDTEIQKTGSAQCGLTIKSLVLWKDNDREKIYCTKCNLKKSGSGTGEKKCKFAEEFPREYFWKTELKVFCCPDCNSPVNVEKGPTGPEVIQDIRYNGYPCKILIEKNNRWYCGNCDRKQFTGIRIPAIQHVQNGIITLRLMASMFELDLKQVKKSIVAEGYNLKLGYVQDLCRDFLHQAEKASEETVIKTVINENEISVYDEVVYLEAEAYRAVFSQDSANKKKFYIFIAEKDLIQAAEMVEQLRNGLLVSKEYDYSIVAIMYVLLPLPIKQKKIISELLLLAKKYFNPVTEKTAWLKEAIYGIIGRIISMSEVPDKEKTVLGELKEMILEINDNVDLKIIEDLLEEIIQDWHNCVSQYKDIQNVLNERIYKFKFMQQELVTDELCIKIEKASSKSKYSIDEQKARLSYYNPISTMGDNDYDCVTDIKRSDGVLDFTKSKLLGRGVPIMCLSRMLDIGLLNTDKVLSCYKERKEKVKGCCKLKSCPFDSPSPRSKRRKPVIEGEEKF